MAAKINEMFSISGKVVAVTGAAGIIYAAISKALAANGAKVALLDIMGDKVNALADEIKSQGGEAIGVECSVLDAASISNALDTIIKTFGRCDALINGAGGNRKGACVARDGNFTDLELDELDKVFALNYKGTVLPSQIFCKHYAKVGKGIIVNTSSMSARAPLTNVPGYSNAKAAVTNYTQWLAVQTRVDFPQADIRVNEIAPASSTQPRIITFYSSRTTGRSRRAASRSSPRRRWTASASQRNSSARSSCCFPTRAVSCKELRSASTADSTSIPASARWTRKNNAGGFREFCGLTSMSDENHRTDPLGAGVPPWGALPLN